MSCTPLKCGVVFKPPTFCIIYKSGKKLRKKTIPLRRFDTMSNIEFVANDLIKQYDIDLPLVKVEKMLRLVQEVMKGSTKDEALQSVTQLPSKHTNLQALPIQELEEQKQLMDSLFLSNQVNQTTNETTAPEEDSFWN